MFFAHWSSTETSYKDMEREQIQCPRCEKETEHTYRYHTQKTKHYSSFSFGEDDKSISIICHGCLLERGINKDYERQMIDKFDYEIITGLAHQYMDEGKLKDAHKLLKKLLKRNPKYGPGLYAMAQCLISQGRYDEAEMYVKKLETNFPENDSILKLRKLMP